MPSLSVAAAAVLLSRQALASTGTPSLMPTPPMGFNNWARFECELNQTLFTDTADAMAERGLLDAGYNWINLDDCWPLHERAENGSLQWDPELFPQGIPWLAEYVKKKGFNFGIYSDAGNETCGGYPGSLDHEEIDARDFAAWGIEYLKLDGCNIFPKEGQSEEDRHQELYSKWHDIFTSSDNPLVFSESAPAYFSKDVNDGNYTDWYSIMNWVPGYGELARHSADVATFKSTKDPWDSVMFNYDQHVRVARVQQPGYINDPDFIIADEPYLDLEEKKSQFALWSSLGAPLILTAHIPDLDEEVLEFLKHRGLIEIDQDPLALQATLVSRDGTWDVLSRTLSNGDRLLTLLNNGTDEATKKIAVSDLGWTRELGCSLTVTDVISGKESTVEACGDNSTAIPVTLPSHGTGVYRVTPEKKTAWTPTGMIFSTAATIKCLTASKEGQISFAPCDGTDGQVWNVGKKGESIRSVQAEKCLSAGGEGDKVEMGPCDGGLQYDTSGNIKDQKSEKCLTMADDGAAGWESCGYLTNKQVFEAPSGWQM